MPGASRPITFNRVAGPATRMTSGWVSSWSEAGVSAPVAGNRNVDGVTPTTVTDIAADPDVRPTIDGSPPKRAIQRSWLSSATGGAPRDASASVKSRPAVGATPSSDRKFQVMNADCTCSGSPPATSVAGPGR